MKSIGHIFIGIMTLTTLPLLITIYILGTFIVGLERIGSTIISDISKRRSK